LVLPPDESRSLAAWERAAAMGLFAIGILLRLRQYLSGRSLWADEAMLALNIINRDFPGMFRTLEYNQGAPVGFLLVEKFFNVILGRNELVLRFFPLMAGFASLWLFHLLLRKTTRGSVWLTALALFAVNPQLVYYSSESKQYMVDVAVALGMLVIAIPAFRPRARKQDHFLLGLAGMAALWLSHPALFVLAGIGFTLVILLVQRREASSLRLVAGMGSLWVANLALLYFINLRDLSRNGYLINYWKDAYLPMPPWGDPNWLTTSFSDGVGFQFGIDYLPWLVLPLLALGWIALLRESPSLAYAVVLIPLLAFGASALRLYPVSGRLGLFLIPLGIILLGEAVEVLYKRLAFNRLWEIAAALTLGAYLICGPLITSIQYLIAPKYYEHVRPAMDYLSASWKDGDELFVSFWGEPSFRFYAPFYNLEKVRYTSSKYVDYPDQQRLKSRFGPLIGKKRVWVLMLHVYEEGGFNERDFIVTYLDEIGRKRREFRRSGTSVYMFLYDLSK